MSSPRFFAEQTFSSLVQEQIKIRQKITGRHPDIPENILLQYFSKTCWVSLISFVNIDDPKLQRKLNVTNPQELSEKIILRNGITSLNEKNQSVTKAGGLGGDKTYGNSFLSKGIRINEDGKETKSNFPLGLRPIPGITSVDIKSKGTYGSLLEANINFVCWDINQLEKLEPLFMRPGYSVLLEWGWSQFPDSEGKIKQSSGVLNFKNSKNAENIQKFITKQKNESFSNRDGMLGLIKNFSWSFRKDGGYDCKLSVISAGEIISSIPSETFNYGFITSKNIEPIRTFTNESNNFFKNNIDNVIEGASEIKGDTPISDLAVILLYLNTFQGEQSTSELIEGFKSILSEESYKKFQEDLESKLIKIFNPFIFRIRLEPSSEGDAPQENKLITYIRLQSFIEILNSFQLLKSNNNNVIKFEISESKCKIDINQFSCNPSVCLIKNKSFKDFSGKDTLMRYATEDLNQNVDYFDSVNYLNDDLNPEYGNLGNIWVSIETIYNSYINNRDNITNFIQDILNKISNTIGGINQFSIYINPEEPTISRIIDLNYIPKNDNEGKKIENHIFGLKEGELEVFTNKSILTDLQITSEIPQSMQTSIAVGAQSSGGGSLNNENHSPYSAFSLGIKDRIYPEKIIQDNFNPLEEIKNYKRIQETLSPYFLWSNKLFKIQENNAELEGSLKNYINWVRKHTIFPIESSQALIPLKLSLEMEGISGILIGQRFGIPGRILPSSYRSKNGLPKMGFVVTEVSHNIDAGKWRTKVSGLMFMMESQTLADMQERNGSNEQFKGYLNLILQIEESFAQQTLNIYSSALQSKEEFSISMDSMYKAYEKLYLGNPEGIGAESVKTQLNKIDRINNITPYTQFLREKGYESTLGVGVPPITIDFTDRNSIYYIEYVLSLNGEERERAKKAGNVTDENIKYYYDNKNSIDALKSIDNINKIIVN